MVGLALGALAFPLAVSAEAAPAADRAPAAATAVSDAAASADVGIMAQTYGPYNGLGTCNYWMYGVRAGGRATSNCWYYIDPGVTCPGGNCPRITGWYFTVY